MDEGKMSGKFATPLRDPKEFFDDWDDTELDEVYLKEFISKTIQEYAKEKGIDTSQRSDDDFYKNLGIRNKRSPEEILQLMLGYIECAENNRREAEQTLFAQFEAIIKKDKEES